MSLKTEAIKGAIWTYSQQFGSQLISFLVSIVLTRLLLPEEFGLIGMIAIFMGLGNALFDGGMTSSLIRSEKLDDSDFSTVFFFNLATSIVVYLLIFIVAPYIAEFYHQPVLKNITRVYALSFVFSAFGTVQNTILTKSLNFKKQAVLSIPALIISAIIALIMAYMKFGVWSLVIMTLVNTCLTSVFLWLASDWKPKFVFVKEKFNKHFYYGYKLTLSGILDIIFTNIYQIIIGRVYSATLVGYYTRANQLMMMPVGNVSTALNKVIFPLFAKLQNEPDRLKNAYKRIMLLVLFIINPIVILMMVLADPLIRVLFTDKWIKIVPIFQIICLSGLLYPLHLYNLIILQVKGRSDLFLKLEIVKKVMSIIVLIISFYYGFYGLLWGQLIFSILALFVNTYFAGQMLDYPMNKQILDIIPLFILAILMAGLIYYLNTFVMNEFNDFLRLVLCTFIGGGAYLTIAHLFKMDSLLEIKSIIRRK